MPLWLSNIGAICSLILEIIKLIQSERARELVGNLTNAKTNVDKQLALNAISAELWKP